jgi:hypothetical protein
MFRIPPWPHGSWIAQGHQPIGNLVLVKQGRLVHRVASHRCELKVQVISNEKQHPLTSPDASLYRQNDKSGPVLYLQRLASTDSRKKRLRAPP